MRRWAAAALALVVLASGAPAGARHHHATMAERAAAAGCPEPVAGVHCGPGNNRRTAGGGDKASHAGWPAISGIFVYVEEPKGHANLAGTPRNDELLGYDGSDTFDGGAGRDVIWGDQHPVPHNHARQQDVLSGGAGDDFLYASHGTNRISGGAGNDFVLAHFGHGSVDCGPGRDTVVLRVRAHRYELHGCEHVRNG